jgi:tryptophan 2,3-dioxygenase
MADKEIHYHDYLQLDKILEAQFPESERHRKAAHDEMLFIVIHQAYELWFKQLHHEVNSIISIMGRPALNDNSPDLQLVTHRLSRMVTVLRVLVHQIDIMETMTPMDFLDFRDMLRPASGFQSWQFKMLEARLGLKFEHRHGKEYYTHQLKPQHVEMIKKAEADRSLIDLVNDWLERIPFFKEEKHWLNFETSFDRDDQELAGVDDIFWKEYKHRYQNSLADAEKDNAGFFDSIFFKGQQTGDFSPAANRAALFIMLYRGYPMLQLPFQVLNNLLEVDEQLSAWRHRHMNMVHRMIGTRIGTGGSTGKDYLKAAADKHYIFKDIAQLTSFLIERRKLPQLPSEVEKLLGFHGYGE